MSGEPNPPVAALPPAHPVRADWVDLPDEALLDVRLCDLGVTIQGSWLEERLADLQRELDGRGLAFHPHYWLSAEWFSPDGVPGVAIPFYLAHPRLMRLERTQMLEVEGGTPESCMQILRHEAGHAFDNAYALRRRRRRVKLFGSPSVDYPDFYLPRPYSKSFVLHLDSWYAQSHPDEDFAETFAVWLTPDADWRGRYSDWPALRKLEYMDELMREIAGKPPVVSTRRRVEPLERLRTTLAQALREEARALWRRLSELLRSRLAPALLGRPGVPGRIRRPLASCSPSAVTCAGSSPSGPVPTSTRSIA